MRYYNIKKKLMLASAIVLIINNNKKSQKRRKFKKRRFWINELVKTRPYTSIYHNLVNEMKLNSDSMFRNFVRMTPSSFESLLCIIAPKILKQHVVRVPITVAERLSLTLRYLASGDSLISISYDFKIGKSTASKIVTETLNAIWEEMHKIAFPELTTEYITSLAQDFERKAGFPNCFGAIDGKHVQIEAPPCSGSTYFNYKKTFSVILLAAADVKGKFIYCDVGAHGKCSDGGVFKNCSLQKEIQSNTLRLPEPRIIGARPKPLPYVLVGDEAFPLKEYLLRPYSARKQLTRREKIYNIRLAKARKVVERAFGILTQRFRIFRRPIQLKVDTINAVIKASVCLHNWMAEREEFLIIDEQADAQWRLLEYRDCTANTPLKVAEEIRGHFADYFMLEGSLDNQ